ncbi:hypothetical protein XENOCAPTIV_027666, partial [Xenoophorus captivus]
VIKGMKEIYVSLGSAVGTLVYISEMFDTFSAFAVLHSITTDMLNLELCSLMNLHGSDRADSLTQLSLFGIIFLRLVSHISAAKDTVRVKQSHRFFFPYHRDSNLDHTKFPAPPGPKPWPLVGNLLQMGDQMHLSLTRLGLQYGDIFQMRFGSLTVVILSGYTTIRQALVRQGEDFAGRPELFTFSAIADGNSMTFSEKYGPAWLLHKKLCKNALRSFSYAEPRGSGATCLLEEQVCAEAAEMVGVIREQAAKNCEMTGIDPAISLVTSVANVVCALCFGRRYDHNDKEFLTIVNINNEVLKLFAAGTLTDFFPVFRYFPNPSLRKMVQYIHRMNGFMEQKIEEHISTFDKVKNLANHIPTGTLL